MFKRKSLHYSATFPRTTIFPSARMFVYFSGMCEVEVGVGGGGHIYTGTSKQISSVFFFVVKKWGLRLKYPQKFWERTHNRSFWTWKFSSIYTHENWKSSTGKSKFTHVKRKKYTSKNTNLKFGLKNLKLPVENQIKELKKVKINSSILSWRPSNHPCRELKIRVWQKNGWVKNHW